MSAASHADITDMNTIRQQDPKKVIGLLRYLTGRYGWQHTHTFEEDGKLFSLYSLPLDRLPNGLVRTYDYLATVEDGEELRVIDRGKLIHTSKRTYINGEGI
jgi:hypothetical protein